ncbi:MAG: protein/domain typically associated with flavoprotein oxygenase, family protein [Verrucomicrobiaceae bacterium]|nr:protein/domain typically associated with flavoprotein oxygenase, family protein [Verrucomicrobiaceae bacterium]
MNFNLSQLSPNKVYFTLIQAVVPRPIAWVLSENDDETLNLAPFSYFNLVCSDPPLLILSIGKKRDGSIKDTRRNIIDRSHFVVHLPHATQMEQVNESSRELPANASEVEQLQLSTEPFGPFPLPRLRDCRIALACTRYQVSEIGPNQQALILGLIEAIYIDDEIVHLDAKGSIHLDAKKLDPLSRLGGEEFGSLGDVFHLPRLR